MNEYLFYIFAILVFLYFCYMQIKFQKKIWFPFNYKEKFTPMQVNKILQEPGSQPIGTMDGGNSATSQMLTVSNGYSENVINKLQPDNPEPILVENQQPVCLLNVVFGPLIQHGQPILIKD
jgi:hypothetical protein